MAVRAAGGLGHNGDRRFAMPKFVSREWVAAQLGKTGFWLVDPRRPMKYLSGHLPGAVNLPVYTAFGSDGRLLRPELLAELMGGAGASDNSAPIIYDSPEGQNAAMLAWILEYLGHDDVQIMDAFFEVWKAEGREVLYRPVGTSRRKFTVQLNPSVRATLDDLRESSSIRFVDFRSREEFGGERALGDDPPGHIPGAVNIVWRELGIPTERLLKPADVLARIVEDAGVKAGDKVVTYCRSGPRAALGYLALRQLGADVRLFDGSFAQWSQAGLPVEK
jgi:thiosulfate/3-mercaptopyruvate sulfurtransferase